MELIFDNMIPVKFYPHSVVLKRIIECEGNVKYNWCKNYLIKTFNNADMEAHMEAHQDNNVVFEVEVVSGNFPLATLYIGFHDYKMSVGFDIHKIN